jgi:hypothetical protein
MREEYTECIAISHFGPPAPNKIDFILRYARHLGVPISHKLHILIHLIRLHLVKHNAMHILSPRKHLREAPLDIFIQLASFSGTVDQARQRALLLAAILFACARLLYKLRTK